MDETKATERRKLWLAEWFNEEAFWKDIAKNVIAGYVLLLLGYTSATAFNIIQRPETWGIAYYLVIWVLAASLVLMGASYAREIPRKSSRKEKLRYAYVAFIGMPVIIFVLLANVYGWL